MNNSFEILPRPGGSDKRFLFSTLRPGGNVTTVTHPSGRYNGFNSAGALSVDNYFRGIEFVAFILRNLNRRRAQSFFRDIAARIRRRAFHHLRANLDADLPYLLPGIPSDLRIACFCHVHDPWPSIVFLRQHAITGIRNIQRPLPAAGHCP